MKKSTCCGAKVTSRMSYDSNSTYPTCVCNACQKPCEVIEEAELQVSPDVLRLNPSLGGVRGKSAVKKNLTVATNKYHVAAKPDRTLNGRVYASKKEMLKAQELDLMVKAGEIDFYLEQVPFRLPGNTVHRVDFVTFTRKVRFWEVHFLETKGRDLPMGKLKRKQTEEIYKIRVELV